MTLLGWLVVGLSYSWRRRPPAPEAHYTLCMVARLTAWSVAMSLGMSSFPPLAEGEGRGQFSMENRRIQKENQELLSNSRPSGLHSARISEGRPRGIRAPVQGRGRSWSDCSHLFW